jgi:acetyltransferase-like isoleucine patch superfamily enzyme
MANRIRVLDFLFNKLYVKKLSILFLLRMPIIKFELLLKDINIGEGCRFYGNPFFYKRAGSKIEIGSNCTFRSKATSNLIGINRRCMISTLNQNAIIRIGNNCGFSGTVIGSFLSIDIGDNVMCGANTLITDSDWHTKDYRSGPPAPVIIGNNVWIGEGAKILKGVTIGNNSVIGAGSIVTKSIPPNSIAAGNPCRILKELEKR